MKTIWKYELGVSSHKILSLPIGYQILHLDVQNNVPHIWALVNPKNELRSVIFYTFGTGDDIETNLLSNCSFVGTYLLSGGYYVYHVFKYK